MHPTGSNAELSRRAFLEAGNQLVCPGTSGAELLDELKPEATVFLDADVLMSGRPQQVGPAEWIMYKPRWGAFYATYLEDHLRSLGVDTVVICGCNFPNCPRTTIYKASEHDFHIVFIPDATSGVYARGLDELGGIGADPARRTMRLLAPRATARRGASLVRAPGEGATRIETA